MRERPRAFPVGLYGMLLFALCWLTLPAVFAPLERSLLGATCLLPRWFARLAGSPAMAAAPDLQRQRLALSEQLESRAARHDRADAGERLAAGFEPVSCAVLVASRRGGGGRVSELLLDHSHAELAACSPWVTKGETLLGWLLRPGFGAAAKDSPADPARVQLLNAAAAPPNLAGLQLADGGSLRFVVGPAAAVDPAPLRVELWDDPYRAARLQQDGLEVRTLPRSALDAVPAGLLLGQTRVWGYQATADQQPLTIGVYVLPPFDAAALSHVVVWRPAAAATDRVAPAPFRSRRRVPGLVHDLPGAVHGRHLLLADASVPTGAAIVQDGLFVGTARGLWFGGGLVTSFALSRQRWSLILLPDAPDLAPIEMAGEVVDGEDERAYLRWRSADARVSPRLGAGYLFTGSNGLHCPAGLYIGRATPHADDPELLIVRSPLRPGPHAVEVIVGEAGS